MSLYPTEYNNVQSASMFAADKNESQPLLANDGGEKPHIFIIF